IVSVSFQPVSSQTLPHYLVLSGTGCDSNGVIRALDENCLNFAGIGGITLEGDILVTGNKNLEFRYGTVNMNGHDLTVAMDSANVGFRFVALTVNNPANWEVLSGRLGIESQVAGGTADDTLTVHSNATFFLNNSRTMQNRRLILKPGARLRLGGQVSGTIGSVDGNSNLAGPVEIEGTGGPVVLDSEKNESILTLSGPVSGTRGIQVRNGAWLQLANPGIGLTGTVSATGAVGSDDLAVTGGVVFVALAGLPYEEGRLVLTNAQFMVRFADDGSNVCSVTSFDFPDLVVHGKSVMTSDMAFADIALKSLRKTGNGPLTMFGRYVVAGETDIAAGTLRFGSSVPQTPCGLNWSYVWGVSTSSSTEPQAAWLRGVDLQGASFGYRGWRPTTGANNALSHCQSHWYTGYIRVPGEEGAAVTCNFVSSLARTCYVKIGGKVVLDINDRTDNLTGTIIPSGYDRMYVGPQQELTAGWQPIFIHLANSWNGTAGPEANTKYGWTANFGLGVDWSGRCTTNSVNYAKFLDPGDGSFLRPCAPDVSRGYFDATAFRPRFAGPVAFGPGAVFDVNDTTPYVPAEIPSLVGVPTVRNGAVAVTTWTLRANDLFDAAGKPLAKPLTIEASASLAFPEGPVTIGFAAADADAFEAVTGVRTYPILTAADGADFPANDFVLPADLRRKGWVLRREGATLNLVHTTGFTVILR
ncbi:MAG: hypothetical protein ACI4Q3_04095, partial [Kiritimatiellia bacterium]